jgi:hypothetical protein
MRARNWPSWSRRRSVAAPSSGSPAESVWRHERVIIGRAAKLATALLCEGNSIRLMMIARVPKLARHPTGARLFSFVGNPTDGRALGSQRGTGGGREMWLALAAITLAAAIGFNILALAIQFER